MPPAAAPADAAPTAASPIAPGAIAGRILYRGQVPEELREPVVPTPCGDEAGPEKLLVSKDGGVANAVVVVLVSPPPAGPTAVAPVPPAVTVDNRGCRFVPRVQVARPGATLLVKNSDAVFHNVRSSGAYELNVGLGGGSSSTFGPLRRKGVVAVVCDIHAWMAGYLYLTDSPCAAVTGPDGRFRLEGVPAGVQRVAIWHEALEGAGAAVEVRPGETSALEEELVLKSR